MPSLKKAGFLSELERRYGTIKKLPGSLSLFEIGGGSLVLYLRYSRIHSERNQAFYGLRVDDLRRLEGRNSLICFLWDTQEQPLFIPYSDFEEILGTAQPASDGQIKSSIFQQRDVTEIYISNVGRFNVDGFFGWNYLDRYLDKGKIVAVPDLNHSQVQTLVGAIGAAKGFDIWIPLVDRSKLDWNVANRFDCRIEFPSKYHASGESISEIDVIWFQRGSSELRAMFEVEHSTPVYSGLLRFNDLYLSNPNLNSRYSIVSNDERRSLFLRQIQRPTFRMSGLAEICSFLEYKDVFLWYKRMIGGEQ